MLITIKAENLSKRFNKLVFKNLNFTVNTGKSLAVTGPNGSGKSTLLEIIADLKKPSSGRLIYKKNDEKIDLLAMNYDIGFSSLKINPYGELTALENIEFAYQYNRRSDIYEDRLKELLIRFDLFNERNKKIKKFSSGMMQRLRFILAILHNPHILILDEPGSNLDISGREAIYSYIESVKEKKLFIIATNEEEEACLCDERLNLEK